MKVDAARIGDRIREMVQDPAALALAAQLRDDMDAKEYCAIATAITRLLATRAHQGDDKGGTTAAPRR